MVLERLISLKEAVSKPWLVFITGAIVSVVSLFVSLLIFPRSVGLYTTFLITLTMLPLMVKVLSYEESQEERESDRHTSGNLLWRHSDVLMVYVAFYSGMVLALSVLFILLPVEVAENIFNDQITEINLIRGNITFFSGFEKILLNNIGVLFIIFLFSLLFGAGSIFILSWNASILSTAIGMSAKTLGGFYALPMSAFFYFPHASFELVAYFVGALAGGMVSVVLTKGHSKVIANIFKDSLVLMAVAVILLVIGAVIEATSMITVSV